MKLIKIIFAILFAFPSGIIIFQFYYYIYHKESLSFFQTINKLIEHKFRIALFILIFIISFILLQFILQFISQLYLDYNPISWGLRNSETLINNGQFEKAKKRLDIIERFVLFKSNKYYLHRVKAEYFIKMQELALAYNEIGKGMLNAKTSDQKAELSVIKLRLFIYSGYIIGAKEIIKQLKKSDYENRNIIEFYNSIVAEKSGDFKKARETLKSLLTNSEDISINLRIKIYNNIGRIDYLFGNDTNKILYYTKSLKLMKENNKYQSKHIAYPNLIDTYLLINDFGKAEKLLDEYKKTIDIKNKTDILNYNNYLLVYYRQKNDISKIKTIINKINNDISEMLTIEEKANLEISKIRIKFNSHLPYLDDLSKFQNNLEYYKQLPFLTKISIYKEIYSVLSTMNNAADQRKFLKTYNEIYDYFLNLQVGIDKYFSKEIKDFEITKKCQLLKDKLFSLNFLSTSSSADVIIDKKLSTYEDIIDIFESNHNFLRSFETRLDCLDECMGLMRNNFTFTQKDKVINNMKLQYEETIKSLESVDNSYNLHPEFYLRLARYSLYLMNYENVIKYFDKFKKYNVSVNHYARWLQDYYHILDNYLTRLNRNQKK